MKKGKSKKLVAWLLALAVLASPSTGFRALADDVDGTGQDAVVSTVTDDQAAAAEDQDGMDNSAVPAADQNDPAAEGEPQEPAADDPAAGEPISADDPTVTGEPQDPATNDPAATGEPVSTDEPTAAEGEPTTDEPSAEGDQAADESEEPEDQAEAVPEYEDGGVINYLFVQEPSIQASGEQNIIISFGEGEEQLTSVTLILTGEDGRQSEIPLSQKVYNYYQFVKTYESQEAGTYRLVAFIYELDGHKKRIDFKNTGISAQFSVTNGDECAEDTGVSVTALTSDEISTDMTYEIENTIQAAAQEAVDNVNDGAVALGSSSTEQSYSRAGVSAELTAAADQAVNLGSYSAKRAYTNETKAMVIVLDPGHGGLDPGTSNSEAGLVEKDLNLKVATYCKNELEKYNGIKVYMTRTGDTNPSLEDRVKAAKGYGAHLFVSIHMNSSTRESVNGAEVYYPNQNGDDSGISEEGQGVAQNILDELVSLGLADRGVKTKDYPEKEKDDPDYKESLYDDGSQADYYSVIRNSKKNGFPGLIVEHAFVTNDEDAANLKKESFLKDLGVADAQGIMKYYHINMDYSAVFDFSYYMDKYKNLQEPFGNDPEGALNYFLEYGMSEGHQASAEFNVDAYKKRYPDLRAAFGNDTVRYYEHYINYGKAEGRIGTEEQDSSTKPNVDASAVFDGVNYGDVYDFDYYIEHYPDLKAVFSNRPIAALEHFVVYGMSEGRQAKGDFNVASYKSRYPDLQQAFGSAWKSYFLHYIEYGKKEGRIAVDDDSETDPDSKPTGVTKYRGVELSPIYNFNYYIEKYSDIKQAFGYNPEKVLEHFVRHGMEEGRSGNADFNVYAYKSNYSDLRKAFGNDLEKYYIHYLRYGIEEGRDCALVAVTTYKGVDYSAVYNFEYYIGRYPELKAKYENDPAGALQHFIEQGIEEGLQAHEDFNLQAYKNNYIDLRNAFGNNNMAYVEHYISLGKEVEHRQANNFKYHLISLSGGNDGNDGVANLQTSVNQMVTYFLAKSTYPTYYANNTNVRTIGEFCQVYWEECYAEGIDPAVAFCQAMKETKFLKFTGDVKVTQFNFAGLGATGNGASGLSFPDIRTGIRAHVQHLKAYATKDKEDNLLKNPCVDPRFSYVQRGSAPYVEWLGIQENPIPGCGWAAEKGYGTSIVNDYMNELSTYSR